MNKPLSHYFPILIWGKTYRRAELGSDLLAAVIVTIMLIPQSLAYALLAGLPPIVGLYASMLPLIIYAVFGSSRVLAVGPVAIVSLMTATSIAMLGLTSEAEILLAAVTLAFMSGLILLLMGVFRLGFIANFLSHPVISGFITAAGILIAVSQTKHILGITAQGHTLPQLLSSLLSHLREMSFYTLLLGLSALAALYYARQRLPTMLKQRGINASVVRLISRSMPVVVILFSIGITYALGLADRGVAVAGEIPSGLPPLTLPSLSPSWWSQLIIPAILISVIGFVESISVAQTLAAKKRQRISPDQELVGLGSANLAAAFSGGYPVTGGLARSVVNFEAGAATPAAGAFTAVGIGLAAFYLTPYLFYLPKATLAATIIVAVLSLVDWSVLRKSWQFSRADFFAALGTLVMTLLLGVEVGVMTGVVVSIVLFMYQTSRPHIAEVGLIEGTEHFRNIHRHIVQTYPHLLTMRIDERLCFANVRFIEDAIYQAVTDRREIREVVLMFTAVNDLDMSALESLEAINHRLADMNVRLHLSEVKGPVMDRFQRCGFLAELTGNVYLSQAMAFRELSGK